jgi:nucleoside phosphorylase
MDTHHHPIPNWATYYRIDMTKHHPILIISPRPTLAEWKIMDAIEALMACPAHLIKCFSPLNNSALWDKLRSVEPIAVVIAIPNLPPQYLDGAGRSPVVDHDTAELVIAIKKSQGQPPEWFFLLEDLPTRDGIREALTKAVKKGGLKKRFYDPDEPADLIRLVKDLARCMRPQPTIDIPDSLARKLFADSDADFAEFSRHTRSCDLTASVSPGVRWEWGWDSGGRRLVVFTEPNAEQLPAPDSLFEVVRDLGLVQVSDRHGTATYDQIYLALNFLGNQSAPAPKPRLQTHRRHICYHDPTVLGSTVQHYLAHVAWHQPPPISPARPFGPPLEQSAIASEMPSAGEQETRRILALGAANAPRPDGETDAPSREACEFTHLLTRDLLDVREFASVWRHVVPYAIRRPGRFNRGKLTALLTVVEIERQAVDQHPSVRYRVELGPNEHLLYVSPSEKEEPIAVLWRHIGRAGRVPAAVVTCDLLKRWDPDSILLAGIAGSTGWGATPLRLGDLVIAHSVFDYSLGKKKDVRDEMRLTPWACGWADEMEKFSTLGSGWKIAYTNFRPTLNDSLLHIYRERVATEDQPDGGAVVPPDITSYWPRRAAHLLGQREINGRIGEFLKRGDILSGDQVIASARFKDQLMDAVGGFDRRCIAVEMEAGGVCEAIEMANSARRPTFGMVRSISDDATPSKSDQWQGVAARLAVEFAIAYLYHTGVSQWC